MRNMLSPKGLGWGVQVAPPSSVRRMVPAVPTAVPVLRSKKDTPRRSLVVPLDWTVQVAPPSSVRMMVPKPPTATTVLASIAATARR